MSLLDFARMSGGPRIRLWLDELPSDAFVSSETDPAIHSFAAAAAAARPCAAIELLRPAGPVFHYGLLGGSFRRSENNELEIRVPLDSARPHRQYAPSLAGRLDEAVVGGTSEYASAIGAALAKLSPDELPCGILEFRCMAHGRVGSSPMIFAALARGMVRALSLGSQPASYEDAASLLTD